MSAIDDDVILGCLIFVVGGLAVIGLIAVVVWMTNHVRIV